MKFEENLRELRKQYGLSQEDLADKLEVSRQAVSKWENGSAYPELDKLIQICDVFHCTMDALLKGDLKEKNGVSLETYEKHNNTFTRAITIGVMLILLGLSLNAFKSEDFGDYYIFGGFAVCGILIMIYYGMIDGSFKKRYPNPPLHVYKQEDIERFERKHRLVIVVSVGMILTAAFAYSPMVDRLGSAKGMGLFFLILMIAIGLLIYFGMQHVKYENTEPKFIVDKKSDEKVGKLCGCVMLLTVATFLIWSFAFDGWHISWVVFPVGGILCGVLSIIFTKQTKTDSIE